MVALCLWLALALSTAPASAFPVRGDGSWSDTFDSTEGINELDDTKVVDDTLRIAEADIQDLGVAVPGESVVHAVLGTTLGENGRNVYSGTGDRGHLVEYDPEELYQEGYQGPSHWGVSNSRGQPWGTSIETGVEDLQVLSLTTDEVQYVYGGTGGTDPDGSLIRFEPYDGVGDPFQRPIEVIGVAVNGGGDILALTYDGTSVFGGTSSGNLFYYDGSFNDLGAWPATSEGINCLVSIGATIYGGTESGHLFSFNGGFTDIGFCPGTGAIESLASDGVTIYGGTADGDVFSYNGGFTDLGNPSGTSDVNALAVSGTDLFMGLENGHVYIYTGVFNDQGVPANSGGAAINALSLGADGKVYGGTANGRLFSQSSFEDQDPTSILPASPVTGICQLDRTIYLSNQAGDLYSYPGPGDFDDLGKPDGTAVNDIDSHTGSIYLGMEGGSLYSYTMGDPPGTFTDLGRPSGAADAVLALEVSGTELYIGSEDGHLYTYTFGDPAGTFTDRGQPSGGGDDIKALEVSGTEMYIGSEDGHVYRYTLGDPPGTFTDLGQPSGSNDVNALAGFGTDVYAGSESGELFSWDGFSWSAPLGDCGSPVGRMAPGNQGVLAGTSDGHLWVYDGTLRDTGSVPGPTAVTSLRRIGESVFGGTAGGKLFSHEDAFLADMGQPVKKQVMIYCMAYDSNEGLLYAGTYRNAHFLIIDPATDKVWDRGRAVNGEREIEDIVVMTDGTVYGGTYAGTGDIYNPNGGRLFTFDPDPVTGGFTNLGEPPAPDDNWWVSALCEGPVAGGPLLYVATSNSDPSCDEGYLFTYDASGPTWTALGVPYDDEGTRSLVLNEDDGRVYGGTWKVIDPAVGNLYSYQEAAGPEQGFHQLGEPPVPEDDRHFMGVVSLAYRHPDPGDDYGVIYGGQDNGYAFSYEAKAVDPGFGFTEKVLEDANAVPSVVTGPPEETYKTIWYGTETLGSGNGRLVNYDPELSCFRDVCETPPYGEQHKVASIAFTSSGVLYGGTGDVAVAGHLFKMAPYKTGEGPYGLSSDIVPGLSDIGEPVSGQDAIGALCAPPGDIKVLYGGTSNDDGTDAHLFMYNHITGVVVDFGAPAIMSGHETVAALCAGTDGYIYVGTVNNDDEAHLFRFYPVFDPGQLNVEDLGVPLAGARGIFSLAAAGNGKVIVGTGDKGTGPLWDGCHLVEYDASGGDFDDKGVCESTQGRLLALVTGTDGLIYGGTGVSPGQTSSANFIKFDPSTGVLENKGVQFGGERSVHSVAQGLDGKIYCGTGPDGSLASYDISGGSFNTEAGWPYTGEAAVLSLTATDDAVLGCAGNVGHLFSFTTPGSEFNDMGPPAFGNTGVPAATTDNLGKPCFGTAGDPDGDPVVEATLVRYDPELRFEWDEVNYTREDPEVQTLAIDITDESGTTVQADVENEEDISAITETRIRLKGRLKTDDPLESPMVEDWGVTWRDLPGIDEIYPAATYRGDSLFIWWSNFGLTPGSVTVGGAAAAHSAWYENLIQVQVPAGASSGNVTVTVGGEPSNAGTFSLLEIPSVASVSPPKAHAGDIVEVKGSWFLDERGASYVLFNGAAGTGYQSWSGGKIEVRVPAGAVTGDLTVNVNGHASNAVGFTVLPGGGPVVKITEPADSSAVAGLLTVRATAQSDEKVDRMEFLVDDNLIGTDKTAPYECQWDADEEVDGAHRITARAYDEVGREGADEITAYVDHTVPRPSNHWYFAEGCTDYGFETWVLIQNPVSEATVAHVTFMDDKGETKICAYDLPGDSRITVNAAAEVPGANISVEVRAGHDVICERAMYWNGRVEGHGSIGATSLSRDWYFAEGCTDYGFETYILVGNPGEEPVEVTLRYMFDDGGVHTTKHLLEPQSRLTVDASEEVGSREFSVYVGSGEPGVVAERAMYYGGRNCGTGTIGAKAPSNTWYLSEGSTDWGFETWLLIQNPGDDEARVTVTYRESGGETVERVYLVGGNTRYTVDLQTAVGIADVSTQVSSDVPVVCERAMYWNNRSAGHCTVGSPGPGRTWYLAEGCTDYGFETWLLIDNPGEEAQTATVTFMTQDGRVVPVQVELPPQCRISLDAAQHVPASSFSVRITTPEPVMAERAMYWNGRQGGTGSIGAR